MQWYYVLLICLGSLTVLYCLFCLVASRIVLKMACTPVAHTTQEARKVQTEVEGVNFDDYDFKWRKQDFQLQGQNGVISGEVIFNDTPCKRSKVVVISHGHTWNRLNSLKYATIFYQLGYSVVMYDQPYFGLSGGSFCTLGYYERHDLSAVIDHVRNLFGKDALLGLHGESMGAVTVLCVLSLRQDVNFVVADCPFSNTVKYYRQLCSSYVHLPSFPVVDFANVLGKIKYGYDFYKVNPLQDVANSNVPICFIHGKQDTFIYPSHSVRLYKVATNSLSQLHLFDGAGHAQSYFVNKQKYAQVVRNFANQVEKSI